MGHRRAEPGIACGELSVQEGRSPPGQQGALSAGASASGGIPLPGEGMGVLSETLSCFSLPRNSRGHLQGDTVIPISRGTDPAPREVEGHVPGPTGRTRVTPGGPGRRARGRVGLGAGRGGSPGAVGTLGPQGRVSSAPSHLALPCGSFSHDAAVALATPASSYKDSGNGDPKACRTLPTPAVIPPAPDTAPRPRCGVTLPGPPAGASAASPTQTEPGLLRLLQAGAAPGGPQPHRSAGGPTGVAWGPHSPGLGPSHLRSHRPVLRSKTLLGLRSFAWKRGDTEATSQMTGGKDIEVRSDPKPCQSLS